MYEAWGLCAGLMFFNVTYGTWLFVARFIVHFVSSTRLPAILRARVQALPPTTGKTSPTRLWAQWPFAPACPASGNYTRNTLFTCIPSLQPALHQRARVLTGAECIVARPCLPVTACAPAASLLWWGVVAETNPRDVAFATCGCTCRPRRPKAPVPISTYYTWNKRTKIVKSLFFWCSSLEK